MERKKTLAVRPALAATFFLVVLISIVVWTPTFVRAATPFIVSFDFDNCTPVLSMGQSFPFNQTSGEVTAYFSSPSDTSVASAFSVQSYDTTFTKLSQFSCKYLYDNKPSRDSLDIMFSQQLTSITLTFATVEYNTEPSNINLIAYKDSIGTSPRRVDDGSWNIPKRSISTRYNFL